MKVLVIPEDQELDQYIVRPVVEKLFKQLGKTPRIDVLPEPRLRGASDALDRETITEIVAENPMVDLFLLLVDRDCNRENNEPKARTREQEHTGKLLACSAWQEIEVWMLAGYKIRLASSWAEVRADCDPKERYAEPLLKELNSASPGGGRKAAMRGVTVDQLMTCDELKDLAAAWEHGSAARPPEGEDVERALHSRTRRGTAA